ncbi:MAG: hypothetical protein ABF904_13890 [Ethanoligenens sp.]
MPDYQKMYHALFNDVTDAISKLQQAQQRTEEMYISSKETVLTPLRQNTGKEKAEGPARENPRAAEKKAAFPRR